MTPVRVTPIVWQVRSETRPPIRRTSSSSIRLTSFSPGTIAALQDSARALQTETRADVAWVTLPTLAGRPIEEAALYIGHTWRIGSAGKRGDPLRNRGLVVLFVPDRRTTAGSNFRIEVGNGLEGTITDSRSRSISAAMREDLRAKRYDAAYLAGWTVAAHLVREDFASRGVSLASPTRAGRRSTAGPRAAATAAHRAATAAALVTVVGFQEAARQIQSDIQTPSGCHAPSLSRHWSAVGRGRVSRCFH